MSTPRLKDAGADDAPVVRRVEPAPSLRVGVGNPFRAPGRTLIDIEPDGAVSLATYRGPKVVRDLGSIDSGRALALIEAATAALAALDLRRLARPLPDEALYLFEIRQGDESIAGAVLPEGAVERDANLLCLLRALDQVVCSHGPGRHFLGANGLD